MMETIRHFFLTVISGTLICSILSGIAKGHSFEKPLHVLCGLFLSLVILHPLLRFQFPDLRVWERRISEDALAVTASGKKITQDALSQIIKSECETYICDKAKELGEYPSVTVFLDNSDPPVPLKIVLEGTISSANRVKLENIIEEALGIQKEMQSWIDPNS